MLCLNWGCLCLHINSEGSCNFLHFMQITFSLKAPGRLPAQLSLAKFGFIRGKVLALFLQRPLFRQIFQYFKDKYFRKFLSFRRMHSLTCKIVLKVDKQTIKTMIYIPAAYPEHYYECHCTSAIKIYVRNFFLPVSMWSFKIIQLYNDFKKYYF